MFTYTDELRRLAWGTDAGFYRLVPRKVCRTESEADVVALLKEASAQKTPVTFRAAGTSLSGQSVSDSVLAVAGKHWTAYSVAPDGGTITLQPGIVGARVNAILAPYGRKFGPDPASIGSCMVGGIVMNNASGMSCGIHANSDALLRSIRIVLADGTVLDTASEESRKAFALSHKDLLDGITAIRDEIRADSALSERIRYKYAIKNVVGLNLLPFVRFEDPFDIIAHLMVGSEGTLAFMSSVTMDTIPLPAFKASAMVYFRSICEAAEAVVKIKHLAVNAAELLDRRSLTSVGDDTGDTAVLIEVTGVSQGELEDRIKAVKEAVPAGMTVTGVEFSTDPAVTGRYWQIRSGIFPTVGGLREEGTTCLIEDVAFHIEDLPQATADLSELLDRHSYRDSCIYGHALEGNFHFIINQRFDSPAQIERYRAMINDVARLVVGKYDGSLKAEHGTGRNMAPFVEFEWGSRAFGIMKRIKKLFDPEGILNPGVIFNDDPECFVKHIKAMPVIEPGAGASEETVKSYRQLNKCIECGFCEVNCVSHGLTLSSRMRIAAQRAMLSSDSRTRSLLEKQYRYYGEETCAGDGLCSTSCPMGINVADLTHELRRLTIGKAAKCGWTIAADHFAGTKNALRVVLSAAEAGRAVLGEKGMGGLCKGLHAGLGLPLWTPSTPGPYRCRAEKRVEDDRPTVVYFPSCFNQMMGPVKGQRPLAEETVALLEKAGYRVIYPENMDSLCCGTIWESKGMPDVADRKTAELEAALLKASEGGRYPVLCDQSPCLHRMRTKMTGLKLYEPAEFIWTFLRERLMFTKTDEPVAVHITCSTRLMKLEKTIIDLAGLCSSNVIVPEGIGCCGFAGDKGMTHPELNKWALRSLREQVGGASAGYSNSRTCEIGLQTHSGIPYMSIVYLVNSHTDNHL